MVPAFESVGERFTAKNYCPVSLLSVVTKVFEKLVDNTGIPQGSTLSPTLFLLYINELPGHVIGDIAIYADDATLYSNCDGNLICGNNLN